MKKRRFRQIRLATNAEIAAIASPALAERLFVDVDNNQLYYIDESGTPQSIQGTGSGATNLAVANNTATTLDVTSDTGTDATIPAAVASTTAGLMTAADKTKLDGVATGATANSSDATLLDRANHTGTQAISTVAGLQIELDNKSDLSHTHTASDITDFDTEVTNNTTVAANTTKLSGIEAGAEVNNISDVNATDLTDGGDSSLHYHSADRNRANHTGTQTASTISDFDTEVSNNASVTANTAKVSADGSINTHSDVDDTGKSDRDLLRYNGSTFDWEPFRYHFIEHYLTTSGTTAITTTAKRMIFNNVGELSQSGIFVKASSVITPQIDGQLLVQVEVGLEDTGTSRSRFDIYITLNSTEVAGSRTPIYVRGYTQGSQGSITKIIDVTNGDDIEVYAVRVSGSASAYQVDNASRIILKFI